MRVMRLLWLGVVLFLGGCSFGVTPFLLNNTGSAIFVRDAENLTEGKLRKGFEITADEGRPIPLTDSGVGWGITLQVGRCLLIYRLPSSAAVKAYPWNNDPKIHPREAAYLKMQIEPDFTVYLVPGDTTTVTEVQQYLSLQKGGFPVTPVSSDCGE